MTQCSDQWLTTVSSLSWTKLLIDLVLFLSISSVSAFHGLVSITKFFLECASVKGERPLPMPVPRGNVVCLRLIRRGTVSSPDRRKLRRPTSPEPDVAGAGPEVKPQIHPSLLFLPFPKPIFPEPDRRPRRNRNSPEPDRKMPCSNLRKKSVTGPDVAGTGCRRNRMSPEPDVAGTGCRRNRMSPEPDVTGTGSEVKFVSVCFSRNLVNQTTSSEPDVAGTGRRRNRMSILKLKREMKSCDRNRTWPEPDVAGTGCFSGDRSSFLEKHPCEQIWCLPNSTGTEP
ncbi:hypothetical protein OSB04_un001296 [Centaurea solstitialis]|uniref:Uncharacterized protein n=1 Tax=Centaurea solstitialis TaxID=347529 RepID=A0AA38SFU2_9ASTR|nr:hypothetical protein OSB04_un001296 [Centaurea solstitialis]